MNQICVLAKNSQTYFIRRLIEEVGNRVALFNPWADFELPEANCYLARTTGVYKSDLDLSLMKGIDQNKLINPLAALVRFRSKSSQYQWFDDQDIPALPWLPLQNADLIQVERFFRLYPFLVVKPLVGQGGWGVEVLTWESFGAWWKKRRGKDESYLLQPYIRETLEFRCFFIEGEAPLFLERSARTGVAANFKAQGSAKVSRFPQEYKEWLGQIISKSGLKYGAIDLFMKSTGPVVLEINAAPGIEQLELLTGKNVIQPLLQMISKNSAT